MAVQRPKGMRPRQGGYREAKFNETSSNHGWYYCKYCGKSGRKEEMEVDHVLPWARGGSNDVSNLAISCRACNRAKGKQTPDEFEIMKMMQEDDMLEKEYKSVMRDFKRSGR